MKTLSELLLWGKEELSQLDPSEAAASAEVLLSEVLNLPRTSLYLEARQSVSDETVLIYERMIRGRKERVPTAYLTGKAYFWNETLAVSPDCLIPRPETETLVRAFLDHSGFSQTSQFSFLDLGAGSGAIGIALLRHFPNSRAVFLDISQKALSITKSNLEYYQLQNRTRLIQSDLFQNCGSEQWDAVLSNPPYFCSEDWSQVDPEVLKEPHQALDGGADGLLFYRRISEEIKNHLRPQGWIVVETGKDQARSVQAIFQSQGLFDSMIFKDDLGFERVVMSRKV